MVGEVLLLVEISFSMKHFVTSLDFWYEGLPWNLWNHHF